MPLFSLMHIVFPCGGSYSNCSFQLYNPKILPGYHFRDDAVLLYDAIHKYVCKYVDLYYGKHENVNTCNVENTYLRFDEV